MLWYLDHYLKKLQNYSLNIYKNKTNVFKEKHTYICHSAQIQMFPKRGFIIINYIKFFRIHRWTESSKQQRLFEIEIFCYIRNIFTVTFEQCNSCSSTKKNRIDLKLLNNSACINFTCFCFCNMSKFNSIQVQFYLYSTFKNNHGWPKCFTMSGKAPTQTKWIQ